MQISKDLLAGEVEDRVIKGVEKITTEGGTMCPGHGVHLPEEMHDEANVPSLVEDGNGELSIGNRSDA